MTSADQFSSVVAITARLLLIDLTGFAALGPMYLEKRTGILCIEAGFLDEH